MIALEKYEKMFRLMASAMEAELLAMESQNEEVGGKCPEGKRANVKRSQP